MPLFKKGEKSDVSNYRPISLISCVGKSCKIVYKHIYNHISANSLLYKYKSGFLPDHSTVHHLIELIHHTCLALEKYETICHVFCINWKAFHRVLHRGLIHKLKKYGISGDLLDWIQNYLYMQNHRVFVNGTFSSLKFILAGVPQGPVLGPLFILIYINDLADYLHGMAKMFADDTSLSFSSNNLAFIEHILNTDLIKLKEWAKKWLIKFNPLKTEVMVISNIHNDYDTELRYDENVLKIVENHKHLGVTISSNNKWSKHVDSIINSASKQISYLQKVKFQLPKRTLNKLYCTYIRPL